MTGATLLRQGRDSVMIPRNNGNEYVVYCPDQVTDIKIAKIVE